MAASRDGVVAVIMFCVNRFRVVKDKKIWPAGGWGRSFTPNINTTARPSVD